MYHILDENNNVIAASAADAQNMWNSTRQMADTQIGNLRISTVFLMVEHYGGTFFETMVFDDHQGFSALEIEKYITYDEAIAGHKTICRYTLMDPTRIINRTFFSYYSKRQLDFFINTNADTINDLSDEDQVTFLLLQ